MSWKILVADRIADEGIAALRSEAEVDVKLGLKPEELASVIGDYDALVVRSETKARAEIIEAGKKLQVIGRAGIGVDNIDLDAATRKGIVVVNAPAGNVSSAAELTLALLLAMARHRVSLRCWANHTTVSATSGRRWHRPGRPRK